MSYRVGKKLIYLLFYMLKSVYLWHDMTCAFSYNFRYSNSEENVQNHGIYQSIQFCISGNSEKYFPHYLLHFNLNIINLDKLIFELCQIPKRFSWPTGKPWCLLDAETCIVITSTWDRHFPQIKWPWPPWNPSQPLLNFSKQI